MSSPSDGRSLRVWATPPEGIRPADGTTHEMNLLFEHLPRALADHLRQHFPDRLQDLCELYLQLGQTPECIFADPATGATVREDISSQPCEQQHVELFASFFAADEETGVSTTKRRGIAGTLHRVSLITHPMRVPEKVLGVAVRVGRAMQGLMETMAWKTFLFDLARKKQSLVLIGKPGVGKTTALREIARTLAEDRTLNVVVVDKTCEIAGDGDRPHKAIGRARWMPVGKPNLQHAIMREAVENQTPDVIIVDEISTPQEVEAARTISQRGVQLIATVHGQTLPELILCKERGPMTGGVASVTLSGSEAERRFDKRKQVQKRAREPVFTAALELHSRSKWILHPHVRDAVDSYFEGEPCDAQQLTPGRATAVAAIPGEGIFEYCVECGGSGGTCPAHRGGHVAGTSSPSSLPSVHGDENSIGTQPSPAAFSVASQSVPLPSMRELVSPGKTRVLTDSSNTNFSFAAGGHGASRSRGRGRRRWRAPRGSGRCFNCNNHGHYARDCPN